MAYRLTLSDEEMEMIGQVLHQDLTSTRNELRRTRNPGYRDRVQHRIELAQRVLERIEQVESEPGTIT